jgi:hypothetical protein
MEDVEAGGLDAALGMLRRRLCFGEIHGAPNRDSSMKGWPVTSRCGAAGLSEANRSTASRPSGSPHSSGPPRPHFDGAVSAGTHSKYDGQGPLGTNFDYC